MGNNKSNNIKESSSIKEEGKLLRFTSKHLFSKFKTRIMFITNNKGNALSFYDREFGFNADVFKYELISFDDEIKVSNGMKRKFIMVMDDSKNFEMMIKSYVRLSGMVKTNNMYLVFTHCENIALSKAKKLENLVLENGIDIQKMFFISDLDTTDNDNAIKNQIDLLRNALVANARPKDLINLMKLFSDRNIVIKMTTAWRISTTILIFTCALGINILISATPIPVGFLVESICETAAIACLAFVWDINKYWNNNNSSEITDLILKKMYASIGTPLVIGFIITVIVSILKAIVILDAVVIPVDIAVSTTITIIVLLVATSVFVFLFIYATPTSFKKLEKEKQERLLEILFAKAKNIISVKSIGLIIKIIFKKKKLSEEELFNMIDFNDEELQKEMEKFGFVSCSMNSKDESAFKDPVIVVESGQTYERDFILKWFLSNDTDPNTKEILESKEIIKKEINKKKLIDYVREKEMNDGSYATTSCQPLLNATSCQPFEIVIENEEEEVVDLTNRLLF